MIGTVMQTGTVPCLSWSTRSDTGTPVYYFGFLGNATAGATAGISNVPGCGPSTANTSPTNQVTQLVSAMASYGTASCCCASLVPLASTESPVLLASAH